MKKLRKKLSKVQFSKKCIVIIMIIVAIDVNLCIILDRMESLAVALATTLPVSFLAYCGRAYFGKKEEEANKLTKYLAELEQINPDEENRSE